jgi:hypothetical protein
MAERVRVGSVCDHERDPRTHDRILEERLQVSAAMGTEDGDPDVGPIATFIQLRSVLAHDGPLDLVLMKLTTRLLPRRHQAPAGRYPRSRGTVKSRAQANNSLSNGDVRPGPRAPDVVCRCRRGSNGSSGCDACFDRQV